MSLAILIITHVQDLNELQLAAIGSCAFLLLICYGSFLQLSKDWRKYEEEQRVLRREEHDLHLEGRESNVGIADLSLYDPRRVLSDN